MPLRVGVYVDAANCMLGGGRDLRYDVLREHACRSGAVVQRLNTYLPIDEQRRAQDHEFRHRQDLFLRRIRAFGWRVHQKTVKRYHQDDGQVMVKANADLDLAVDALAESDRLDLVVLVSGDGDFCPLVRALQSRGCRVEGIGLRGVSGELRRTTDSWLSGFLVPGLVSAGDGPSWGRAGSVVRGVLDHWNADKQVGVLRFLVESGDRLWDTDPRSAKSPWERAFVHASAFTDDDPQGLFMSERVVEFRIDPNPKNDPPWQASECLAVD